MTIGRRFIDYSEKQMQKWMRWSLTMFRKYRLQYMRVGCFHQLSGNTNPKNTHSIIEATAKSGPWRLCTPKKHIFHVRGSWKNKVAHGSKMSENSNVMKPKCAKLVIFKKGVFLKCMFLMGFRKSSASTFCWRRRMPVVSPLILRACKNIAWFGVYILVWLFVLGTWIAQHEIQCQQLPQ